MGYDAIWVLFEKWSRPLYCARCKDHSIRYVADSWSSSMNIETLLVYWNNQQRNCCTWGFEQCSWYYPNIYIISNTCWSTYHGLKPYHSTKTIWTTQFGSHYPHMNHHMSPRWFRCRHCLGGCWLRGYHFRGRNHFRGIPQFTRLC